MPLKIAINGFGRIGRLVCRAWMESGHRDRLDLVAINDITDAPTSAHLLSFDSVHGRAGFPVRAEGEKIHIGDAAVRKLACADPSELPWKELGVDLVLECSGRFATREAAGRHLRAGAGRVLVSALVKDADRVVVFGVNHAGIGDGDKILSNASCTTNCLAPMLGVLQEKIGIQKGYMHTVHAYTGDQRIVDTGHSDWRRARAAALNLIPTSTSAASIIGLILPALDGKLDGHATRIPSANVSMTEFNCLLAKKATPEEINGIMQKAAAAELRGVLGFNELPLVSGDFNHDAHSAVFDATQTRVVDGDFAMMIAWYDNEWGFSNRMIDVSAYLAR